MAENRDVPHFMKIAAFAVALAAAAPGSQAAAASAGPATATAASAATDTTRLTFRPYTIKAFDGIDHPVEMGRLVVPELHARPTGKKIAVVFLRFKTPSPTPGPPIVFLPGGPGYPGTLLARTPMYIALFEKLRARSDVIVIDQRGSGLSEPTLQCAVRGSLPLDAFETDVKTAGALGSMVRPCVHMVRNDGIAIEAYNTVESAEDLEDLRQALGAAKLSLIGVSYGTELALETIRRHGDRIDAAVLVGTRGPDMAWRLPAASDFQLKRFAGFVAADPKWGQDLPDFEGTLRHLLERLAWRPVSVSITDVKTGQRVRVRVGQAGVQAILGSDLNDWARAPLLPAIFASLARGDSTLFFRRVEDLVNTTGSGISVMQIATDCASGASVERKSLVAREAEKALLGNVKNMLVNPAFCDLVGNVDLGPAFREPIYSPVRTLFLTGDLDGITPPFQAEEVRWGFPNGTHIVVENGWHELLPFHDPQQVVVDFFAGQDVRGRRVTLPRPSFLTIADAKAYTAPRSERPAPGSPGPAQR
ncbi:MAG: alpha/beta fold hydrolase [Bacteroidota bacterium]